MTWSLLVAQFGSPKVKPPPVKKKEALTKFCRKCEITKDVYFFYAGKPLKDGSPTLACYCKECAKKIAREWKRKNHTWG